MSDPGTITLPDFILEPLNDLVQCVCQEVNLVKPVCECMLVPGQQVAWYYCGECSQGQCGMAWVRVMAVFPYQTFPSPAVDTRCHLPLALTCEVGVVRCMPMPGDDGTPPTKADMEEAALLQTADMLAIYRAVVCCGATYKAVAGWQAVGPQGDCVGGFWVVHLAVD